MSDRLPPRGGFEVSAASGARPGAPAGAWRRLAALPDAARLAARMERARRRERVLLERLGETVSPRKASSVDAEVLALLAKADGLGEELAAARSAAAASLERDRADYPQASPWARPVVVARGLLDRLVLRDRQRRIARSLRPIHRDLGAASLDGRLRMPAGTASPGAEGIATEISERRRDHEAARAERLRLLAPWDGKALPEWARRALGEVAGLGAAVAKEARLRLLPRLPGLVGLAAGWWVAHAFTSSYWDRLTDGFGLRSGGPTVVSEETHRRLQVWVPLLAAAVCAYLGSRLSASLDRRYSGPPPDRPS